MPISIYFGRPLFFQAEPFGIQLAGNVSIGGDKKSCDLQLRFDHKLYMSLTHHKASGILIDSITADTLQRSKKEIMARFEFLNVTVNNADPDQRNVHLNVVFSFERMTNKIF